MSQKLSEEKHEWYFLEVEIQYPENLRNLHNNVLFLHERINIQKIEKIVANLHDKINMLFTWEM